MTRNGVNGQWTGGIKWDLTATGVLTAAASGYFEWKVLWFEGREEIFKLESFPLGTITVKLGGELKPNGDVTCPTRDFDIVLGSPPEARKVAEKRTAPAGGGQAQVAPKRTERRRAAAAGGSQARRQPARAQPRRPAGRAGRAAGRRRPPRPRRRPRSHPPPAASRSSSARRRRSRAAAPRRPRCPAGRAAARAPSSRSEEPDAVEP